MRGVILAVEEAISTIRKSSLILCSCMCMTCDAHSWSLKHNSGICRSVSHKLGNQLTSRPEGCLQSWFTDIPYVCIDTFLKEHLASLPAHFRKRRHKRQKHGSRARHKKASQLPQSPPPPPSPVHSPTVS